MQILTKYLIDAVLSRRVSAEEDKSLGSSHGFLVPVNISISSRRKESSSSTCFTFGANAGGGWGALFLFKTQTVDTNNSFPFYLFYMEK